LPNINPFWKNSVIILVNNLCARQFQTFAASKIDPMNCGDLHKSSKTLFLKNFVYFLKFHYFARRHIEG